MRIFYFILGIVCGSIAALLFAPRSGKETREDLKNIINSKEKDLEYYIKDKKNQVEEFVQENSFITRESNPAGDAPLRTKKADA